MREIRMLRVMWRELETGSRTSLAGHEGGNLGYRQGLFYRVTAPALDPTKSGSMQFERNLRTRGVDSWITSKYCYLTKALDATRGATSP